MINRPFCVFFLLIVFGFVIGSTVDNGQAVTIQEWKKTTVTYPDDNPFSEASIELGGELFFENLLDNK